MQEVEENNRMGKTGNHFKNWRFQGIFHGRMGMIRDRNKDITEAEQIRKR